jgi:hypothetical protein
MATQSSKPAHKPATKVEPKAEIKPELKPAIPVPAKDITPVNVETQTPSDEPIPAPAAAEKEVIETDIRKKLARKTDSEDVFVPTSPAALENAAKTVAEAQGFEFNRGTSIGARLMARSRKMV